MSNKKNENKMKDLVFNLSVMCVLLDEDAELFKRLEDEGYSCESFGGSWSKVETILNGNINNNVTNTMKELFHEMVLGNEDRSKHYQRIMEEHREYSFQMSWEMAGQKHVTARSYEEAVEKAKLGVPPVDGEFIADSLVISEEEEE